MSARTSGSGAAHRRLSAEDRRSATPEQRSGETAALQARVAVAHADLDVTLDVAAGEVLAVMGPSGAGKTTLVETLAGLGRLSGGSIRLGGRVLADERTHTPPALRGVGLLGQDARLFPHMTAAENIAFAVRLALASSDGPPEVPLRSAGAADPETQPSRRLRVAGAMMPAGARRGTRSVRAGARGIADEWMDRIGLPAMGGRRVHELSGGQRQRVALARALAARPSLLLLDEPFSSLDVEAAAQLREVVSERISGTTTIVVSHSAADAMALADRLVIVEHGRVAQLGLVADVLASPATSFVRAVAASSSS